MHSTANDPIGEALRARGLRNTPQRRGILAVFERGSDEHLSADEVHARASLAQPNLSRGTVYATLAELAERGLLSAVGLPEPVRYEINTDPHDHFRCRLCMRLFDLAGDSAEVQLRVDERFLVERVVVRAEGVCAQCSDYQAGLLEGIEAIRGGAGQRPWADPLESPGVACARVDGPLGAMYLAATPAGLVRLAFEEHFDADAMRARIASRRGTDAARGRLRGAAEELERFLAGDSDRFAAALDGAALATDGAALTATRRIPYASHRSYSRLGLDLPARELGLWMGANPVPILFPCHRVSRGSEIPESFVAGLDRRRWLEVHERQHRGTAESQAQV